MQRWQAWSLCDSDARGRAAARRRGAAAPNHSSARPRPSTRTRTASRFVAAHPGHYNSPTTQKLIIASLPPRGPTFSPTYLFFLAPLSFSGTWGTGCCEYLHTHKPHEARVAGRLDELFDVLIPSRFRCKFVRRQLPVAVPAILYSCSIGVRRAAAMPGTRASRW